MVFVIYTQLSRYHSSINPPGLDTKDHLTGLWSYARRQYILFVNRGVLDTMGGPYLH